MKAFIGILLAFSLVGCANKPHLTPIESSVLINQSVESVANSANTALQQDIITVDQACKVDQYGRLALDINKAVVNAWLVGDVETAEEHVRAARQALAGTSESAKRLVEDNCGGTQ